MKSITKSNDNSPSCWICLCDEPDDDGKRPVRDCSCRGDTGAGYAHLSCLVQYAQTKTTELSKSSRPKYEEFFTAWQTCPNCEQNYQHEVALDLANSLILFMKDKYPESKYNSPVDYIRMIDALQLKVLALLMDSLNRDDLRLEGIKSTNRTLELLNDIKRTTKEKTYVSIEHIIINKEATAYGQLGSFHMLEGSYESKQKAIYYCQKSHDLYKSNGDLHDAISMKSTLNIIKNDGHTDDLSRKDELKTFRQFFNDSVRNSGMNSTDAMSSCTTLGRALFLSGHGIESERILTKYLPISRRVHGDGHDQTKAIENLLYRNKARFVMLESGEEFQVLRYEDCGNKCVIQGPVKRDKYNGYNEGSAYTVDSSSLLLTNGTPIICRGLKKAAHLNGKLADVRSFDKDKERYTVYFEDTSLKPVAVKKENVRIAFDLPEVE